jgi:D-alanyl-D-alanine carboxypeptidase (penicillin-binding protein 5/6)
VTDLNVLHSPSENGRGRGGRRQKRRRHLIRRTIGVLVLAVVVLIVISLVETGSGHHQRKTNALKPARPVTPKPDRRPASFLYGRARDPVQVDPRLKLGLRAGMLFDVRSGRVLWERDPDRRLPIASLTKMMTALVVAEDSSPDARVLITRQATDFSGSGVGLLPRGKRVPELPLLYGLLLPSGNDAAMALAQHVAGTSGRFVRLMNAEAARLGLTCTRFSNVSGIVDQDNYSCARDLAVLAHAVVTQPLLRRIVATGSAILRFPIKGGKLYLYNNNPLLMAGYPGADGVKTGFTTASGLCLVATARRAGHWLGVVLLHSGNWLTQAETLLDAGFVAMRRAGPTGRASTAGTA